MKLTLAVLFAGVLCAQDSFKFAPVETLESTALPVACEKPAYAGMRSCGPSLRGSYENASNFSTTAERGARGKVDPPGSIPGCQQTNSTQWRWSVATIAAANALDMASSRGLYETNPVLGRGPFGARQVAIKSGLVAGLVLAEYRIIRKWPKAERPFRWLNYVAAGITVGVAVRNYRQ